MAPSIAKRKEPLQFVVEVVQFVLVEVEAKVVVLVEVAGGLQASSERVV